jgi:hypothetical protein
MIAFRINRKGLKSLSSGVPERDFDPCFGRWRTGIAV